MNNLLKDEPMSKHTTLQMGGPAKFFAVAKTNDQLIGYIKQAAELKVPFFVIGEGSNLLVNDEGYNGLIISNRVSGIKERNGTVLVKTGTNLQKFIDYLIDHGLAGMERMSGIAGNVGGAIYGNAGAYGQTISDHLTRVKVFDGKKIRWLPSQECKFEYRESAFKKNKYTILQAEFELEKADPTKLSKDSLETIEIRKQKYLPGIKCPGSFYKNVVVDKLEEDILKKIPNEKIMYGKVPTGYLMEAVGAKGAKRGNVKIANHHGNLILNLGGGKAKDFIDLASFYAKKVEEKFGIKLEPEVQLLGFDK